MKLKVCGLTEEENISQVMNQFPDFIGFIFYEKSPRCVTDLKASYVRGLSGALKVGVFVNALTEDIKSSVDFYGLDMVQLHGHEPLSQVKDLKKAGLSIIKAFRVMDQLPTEMEDYAPYCDLFLFDTYTPKFGGSGRQFDWSILSEVSHPFLLSGGIGKEDLERIKKLDLKHLVGLDINSKVEVSPGIKDIEKVKAVKRSL